MNRYANENCCLQVLQQIQDLNLDGNVQRRDRFIRHYETRSERERARYRNPLSLAATECMRVSSHIVWIETDHLQQLGHLVLEFAVVPRSSMNDQWLSHNLPYGHSRIERGVRILKYHGHVFSDFFEFPRLKIGRVYCMRHCRSH